MSLYFSNTNENIEQFNVNSFQNTYVFHPHLASLNTSETNNVGHKFQ